MSDLLNEFAKPSFQDWKEKLISDLKGKSEEVLITTDPIEGIEFSSYQHAETTDNLVEQISNQTYIRNTWKAQNSYLNCVTIMVDSTVKANKDALEALNMGANALCFELNADFELDVKLFDSIELQYIHTTFKSNSVHVILNLFEHFGAQQYINYQFDAIEASEIQPAIEKLLPIIKSGTPILSCNGFGLNSIGGNVTQELAYQLSIGNFYIESLLENGLSIDEAVAAIRFDSGIGANYFYEVAKFKALRILWKQIVNAYQPKHNCSNNTQIFATTGFINKSVKDPYTNLLRQTTEAMSALSAGVNGISILPYDLYSTKGASTLSKRMAINIPTILAEESYLDKVVDPYGGSYSVIKLVDLFAEKAWKLFQDLEQLEDLNEKTTHLTNEIYVTNKLRIDQINTGQKILIGINKFPTIDTVDNSWNYTQNYLGHKGLILEQSFEKIEA